MSVHNPGINKDEKDLVSTVVKKGRFSQGEYVDELERLIADRLEVDPLKVVVVSNGTAALHLAAIILAPRMVTVPASTFVATANAFKYTGAEIKLLDIDKDTWNCDEADVAVDIFGNPISRCPMIEDAAEALGSLSNEGPCGTLGEISCLSFFENKVMTTAGEGGAMICRNKRDADRARLLRQQGKDYSMPYAQMMGYNYRLTEIQAAFGVAQIGKLDRLVYSQIVSDSQYRANLKNSDVSFQKLKGFSNRWLTGIVSERIENVKQALDRNRIAWRPMFPPLSCYPWLGDSGTYPNAEYLYKHGILLKTAPDSKENKKISLVVRLSLE